MYSSILQKAPLAIVGLIFLAAILTIYLRSKNVTRNEFFKLFKGIKLFSIGALILTVLLTGTFAVFHHLNAKQYVCAIVALNYSEASEAQNSNGTRFNMTEIICDEVVARAIEKGAFEDVTVKQLESCLSVYPYVQGDVSDESNYHISTEFVVDYYASKDTQHLNAENVITLITSAYKDYYIEKYTDNFTYANPGDVTDYSEMEYMDVVTYLNKKTTSVLNYLYGMAEKAPSFVTSNNTSFNSIAGKVFQFKNTQIEQNLQSLILQHGIVKDKQTYIDRLSYQNTNIEFTRLKNAASYNLCNDAIDMYAEDMARVVLVPTWDQIGKYYMGRTKVGIDELSVMASSFSATVAQNEKELMSNELIIEKMQDENGGALAAAQADKLIAEIDQSLLEFTQEAITAGREYSDYKMNQCIAVSISGSSLFNELKTIVIFAVCAYLSAMAYNLSKKFPKA